MKPPALVVGVLLAGACSSSGGLEHCVTGERSFLIDGRLVARGRHTLIENREYLHSELQRAPLPRWREFLRTGPWLFQYETATKRAVVSYQVAFYTDCCAGGFCKQPYEFLAGTFEAWWPNGQLLARGRMVPTATHIDTNCEGGDTLLRGVPSRDTAYWNSDGSPADSAVLLIAGFHPDDL